LRCLVAHATQFALQLLGLGQSGVTTIVTNNNGDATQSLMALKFSSVTSVFAATHHTLGLDVLFHFGQRLVAGRLFQASIKEVILALPIAPFRIGLDVAFDTSLEFVDSLGFKIGIDTGHLIQECCGSFAPNAA
jgi:hypothetical protein